MSEHYSPLRYPGGKAKLSPFLVKLIQTNDLGTPDYVEPYAGGAGAALRLLFEEYVDSITINDVDPRIYCFWQAAVKRTDRFLERLEKVPLTVTEWRKQREVYLRCDEDSPFDLGFATFYLNRTTRSGIVFNAGPIGGLDQTGNYKIDARFNRGQLGHRICRLGAYADRIIVSKLDGLNLLRRIGSDRSKARNTLVYLDPPYYVKGAELYLNRFDHDDHQALAEHLGEEMAFPWVMTYDSTPEINALYSDHSRVQFYLSYSAFERRTGEELLIHPETLRVPAEFLPAPLLRPEQPERNRPSG